MAGKHVGTAAYTANGAHPPAYPGSKENRAWGEGRAGTAPQPTDVVGAAAWTAGANAAAPEEAGTGIPPAAPQLVNGSLQTDAGWTLTDATGTPPSIPTISGGVLEFPLRTGTGHLQRAIGALSEPYQTGETIIVSWSNTVEGATQFLQVMVSAGAGGGSPVSNVEAIDSGTMEVTLGPLSGEGNGIRFDSVGADANSDIGQIFGSILIRRA